MSELHRCQRAIEPKDISKEGEHRRLCSNIVNSGSPSLDFKPRDPLMSEDIAIDYLADILVDIYLDQKQHGDSNPPSIK